MMSNIRPLLSKELTVTLERLADIKESNVREENRGARDRRGD